VRVINTQDVFRGALIPAAILVVLCAAIAWWNNRREARPAAADVAAATSRGERITALLAVAVIVALLGSVTLGYMYAVEAAATGGVLLFLFGLATRTLTRPLLTRILRDTMAITGALFALLVAATTFTLVLRAFGTDRWVARALTDMGGGENGRLLTVMLALGLCAFVLDAFEMIFVVIPVLMPPLLMQFPDATRAAVLTLLILQASFLVPPLGYAVLMVRQSMRRPLAMRQLAYAMLPYLCAQLCVLALVAAFPALVWRDAATVAAPPTQADAAPAPSLDELLKTNGK
jgi:TRAP-type mannitol/chloroaromatic compound transport system permease large subunit